MLGSTRVGQIVNIDTKTRWTDLSVYVIGEVLMAKARGIENIERDLTGNLERDLNTLVRVVLSDLSTKEYSPVDTGFFVSSWTAGTQRPRPDEARESVAPWSNS